MSSSRIVLARHVLPDFSIGASTLTPQNLVEGPDRLAYLDGQRRYLEQLTTQLDESALREAHARLPYGELFELASRNGKWAVKEKEGARDRVSFDQGQVSVAMLDGKNRGAQAYHRLPIERKAEA